MIPAKVYYNQMSGIVRTRSVIHSNSSGYMSNSPGHASRIFDSSNSMRTMPNPRISRWSTASALPVWKQLNEMDEGDDIGHKKRQASY